MNTRPDIAHAVGLLSRFSAKPTLPTCKLRVYLLQYVLGTVAKGIRFGGSAFDMHVFTDADWPGDIKSLTGLDFVVHRDRKNVYSSNMSSVKG